MRIKLTWEEVCANPLLDEAVEQVKTARAKSRIQTKSNQAPLDKCVWHLCVSEQVRSYTVDDLLQGKKVLDQHPSTPEEEATSRLLASLAYLEASYGRVCWGSEVLAQMPQVVYDNYLHLSRERFEERERIASLTPDERRAEVTELLSALSCSPGFFALLLPDAEA